MQNLILNIKFNTLYIAETTEGTVDEFYEGPV